MERLKHLKEILRKCSLCPNNCHVNRLESQKGRCGTGSFAKVYSYSPHFGEENVLKGYNGSGTIFLTGCNLTCVYCQNYDISQNPDSGDEVTAEELADIILYLQDKGCHNINFVSPTHVAPQIVDAVLIAKENGLSIPLVYNTGGYDSLKLIKLLDGIIDIYMPDVKYSDDAIALKYSGIKGYFTNMKKILKEMHRQVGDLLVDSEGIAYKGLLIRHLILPNNLAGSEKVLKFISEKISPNSYVNIMQQYYPTYKASNFTPLNRRISQNEYLLAIKLAQKYNLNLV